VGEYSNWTTGTSLEDRKEREMRNVVVRCLSIMVHGTGTARAHRTVRRAITDGAFPQEINLPGSRETSVASSSVVTPRADALRNKDVIPI
jgi:hypothetical protein